jgi:NADH-quinone oxidoreductase subunit M
MTHFPILSLLIWLPILAAIVVLIIGDDAHANKIRILTLITTLVSLILCGVLWAQFALDTYQFQFVENLPWIAAYHINYALGIDGISLPMVVLTVITTLTVILASWHVVEKHVAQYLATFLLMQGMVIGVFCATDSILFYMFWEAMLIPIYINIGIWGGERRVYASLKFFIYTFAGSVMMLVAILYLRVHSGSFEIPDFYTLRLTKEEQDLIFIAFLLAFSVKVPMWPVHTWLPDAHTEAPAGGSVVLAALMLKLGIYGFMRFSLPITPDASHALSWLMIALALVAIVYIGLVAIVQTDMKRLIAYSSIAHMGFAVLGTFMIYLIMRDSANTHYAQMSLEGAMVQMVSHAFSTGALFIGVGILYARIHSRLISDYSGVARVLPVFAVFMMIFSLSNVGMPGTSGFVGEFFVILSAFKANFWIAFLAALTLILGAAYTLWMYKRVFFGKVTSEAVATLKPIEPAEFMALVILAFCVIFIGVYPQPLLNVFHASIGHLLDISLVSKL